MQESRITGTITVEDKTAALDFLSKSEQKVTILIDLPPGEKQKMTKWSEDDLGFFEQALTIAEQDDSFLPRAFDVSKFREKKEQFDIISEIRIAAIRFLELVEDTRYTLGSEVKKQSLDVYGAAKKGGQGSGFDNVLRNIGKRFRHSSKKNDDEGGDEGDTPTS